MFIMLLLVDLLNGFVLNAIGDKNPMKRSEVKAKLIGKKRPEHSEWMKEYNPMTGKKRPDLSERKRKRIGKNNPMWNDGVSFFPYPPIFNEELKQFIKDRDNNECQNPYCDHKSERLTTHHINYNKQDCSQFNLITLCYSCNIKANKDRKDWQRLYKKIIWSKY
jgi:hypothetical protein